MKYSDYEIACKILEVKQPDSITGRAILYGIIADMTQEQKIEFMSQSQDCFRIAETIKIAEDLDNFLKHKNYNLKTKKL